MKKIIVILIAVSVCSFAEVDSNSSKKIVWPSGPDEARIEYVKSVTNANDFGIEKSFFSKVFDFVFGEDVERLYSPFGIEAKKNRVLVTDVASKKLYIFDKENNKMISSEGSNDETFAYPIDVVSDKIGNIYVSDSVLAKIFVFNKDGKYKYSIVSEKFQRPIGIALSPDDKYLYIVDSVACQIHITSPEGKFIKSIGKRGIKDGEFNKPTFMAVSKDSKLYVTDTMNHRIQILTKEGDFIDKFGRLGKNIGDFGSIRGIALDSDDNIYVTDVLFNKVHIFNKNGELLMLFGRYGQSKRAFALPEDISITSENEIYITDTNNKRFKVFKRLDPAQIKDL